MYLEAGNDGREYIVLHVAIPFCKECIERISNFLKCDEVDKIDIGYFNCGIPFFLYIQKDKHPDFDYWDYAERCVARLKDMGYRVL